MLDFLGIGAQKAATTWLYQQLASHPDIHFPAGKEVHYWDRTPDPDGAAWQKLFDDASSLKKGEITGAYALLPVEQVRMIKTLYPALRVFYSIRNPIERSWAQVRMRHHNKLISLDDQAAVFEFFASPHCAERNKYVETIESWRGVFGQDQFHCLFFDDIVADPRAVLVRLAGHIGVDPEHFRQQPEAKLIVKVFPGVEVPMPNAVHEYLAARYAGPIDALGLLLGRDLSSWTRRVV